MDEKKKVREISLGELVRNTTGDRPEKKIRKRRRIEADDPYFSVLDSSRDFMVWMRRHKDLKKEMDGELSEVMLQLEKLLHKMQSGAIESEYDYSANYNACYFDMAEIFNLLGNFRAKLGVFMRNEKHVMAATGMSQKSFSSYKARLKGLLDVCDRMERNIRVFMESLEKEYGLDPVLPEVRSRILSQGSGDNV